MPLQKSGLSHSVKGRHLYYLKVCGLLEEPTDAEGRGYMETKFASLSRIAAIGLYLVVALLYSRGATLNVHHFIAKAKFSTNVKALAEVNIDTAHSVYCETKTRSLIFGAAFGMLILSYILC